MNLLRCFAGGVRRLSEALRASWSGRYALAVLSLWIVTAAVSLAWLPYPLWHTDGYDAWSGPSWRHWLGTDGTGADVLSWLMAGSRTQLVIVLATVAMCAMVGVGLLAVMSVGGIRSSQVCAVAVDALIAIPTVLVAVVLSVLMGASVAVVVLSCAWGYGLNLARVARPRALLVSGSGYVLSALVHGASRTRVFMAHVLPNVMPVLIVQLSLSAGTAILAESGLTYLGIGVPSGTPSWGRSLAMSARLVQVNPWAALWPGLLVTAVVLALNLCGDALRERTGRHSSNTPLKGERHGH